MQNRHLWEPYPPPPAPRALPLRSAVGPQPPEEPTSLGTFPFWRAAWKRGIAEGTEVRVCPLLFPKARSQLGVARRSGPGSPGGDPSSPQPLLEGSARPAPNTSRDSVRKRCIFTANDRPTPEITAMHLAF